MALNLNIPDLQDDPIFIAETRPQKIKAALAVLKTENAMDMATYLQAELETLNRQKVSASSRLQALDCYRPHLMRTVLALAESYRKSALPLHDEANLAATTAGALWLELGYGYKLALVDLQNQLIKLGTDKNSAHAIQYAMHAIAEHALVYYQTYVIPPAHIWSDFHQLYFCAVLLDIQNISVQHAYMATEKNIDPNLASASLATSIENTYKHALLMSLAEPQHLIQQDIRLIAEYLAHYIHHTQISAVTALDNISGAFIIDLSSNKPPTPYSKQNNQPNPLTDILFQTIDLVRTMHQDLSQLQRHQLPKNGSIPADANRDDYAELLTYLIKHWGITPQRIFNRSLKNGDVDLVVGISDIWQASEQGIINNNANNHPISDISSTLSFPARPSRWKTLNISATGILLRRHHTAEKNIRIGDLIGIKGKGEPHWSIGIIRWANCGNRDRLDIGVQFIAPQAHSAVATMSGRCQDERVLLLPEIAAIKQAATIIAPRGTHEPARQLTLTYNSKIIKIMLTMLVERSHFAERIQYSIVG
ncbi:MAG: hypothetical protein Q8S46_05745 [Methylotenera sp.]|nr:hypothetical protein [Methylotenera sp.]MDP1755084.1 hypothetical protein [Methylotenera sp.]MDP1960117.1 hypothetical protein [Methylotenera sp.]MDP3207285.1 hypothetical protein [Methylotenera sp.]MDP3303637.1 hypothetical protein [Methylotenera sp.]